MYFSTNILYWQVSRDWKNTSYRSEHPDMFIGSSVPLQLFIRYRKTNQERFFCTIVKSLIISVAIMTQV